jgi:exodeoxyribonuclease VII large subunit
VAPDQAGLLEAVRRRSVALQTGGRRGIESAQQRLDDAQRSLATPQAPLRALGARIAGLVMQARLLAVRTLSGERAAIARRTQRLAHCRPETHVPRGRLQRGCARLTLQMRSGQDLRRARVESLGAALSALDPGAVLARGYAIAFAPDGRSVRDAQRLGVGDRLRLRFARGAADARVERIDVDAGDSNA